VLSVSSAVTRERLLSLLAGFQGRRLVVAGDFVLDRFLYGHPKRVSREAPVLILSFWKEESLPGGAGNTAANVRSLGGVPLPVGAVGKDEFGASLLRVLSERDIDVSGLCPAERFHTPTKTRILGGAPHSIKQQIVRYDREDAVAADDPIRGPLVGRLRGFAAKADGAVLSDYGYGSIDPDAVRILRAAARPGTPILVDSRHNLSRFRGVDAVTPNEEELEECSGQTLGDSVEKLTAAGTALSRTIECPTVLVTRGSQGMALLERGREAVLIPVHGTDQVADVTGAGDTVLAAFSLAIATGATALEAAHLANFAGGVVVMKMGTAVATPDELARAIESDRTLTP